ncbi:MAG: phosphate propanoyltransferase [Deltaproteobacteria bacterium]|nr:phosphate propanoyltransferase [Deltaproteobacteria bacterium]MBW1871483.1 phosphate propanoyltransferase [Deltaproteobacteria bacterium]
MNIEDRTIPVALSARHVHLSKEHIEELFGRGYQLTPMSDLSQPRQFAARELVEVVGPRRSIPGVRVLGPARSATQVEMSVTDGYVIGVNIPVRLSGDIAGSPGVHLIGPRGAVKLTSGCICAVRHIHATVEDARKLNVVDRQKVYVRFPGPRSLIFDEVVVRVSDNFATELHLDTDEGNSAGVRSGERVEVLPDLCRDLCTHENCSISGGASDGVTRPFCELTASGVRIR